MFLSFRPFQTSVVWEFVDPDTQRKFTAESRESLVRQIVKYRAQNELEPIENLHMVLDHYLCTLPINSGKCRSQTTLRRGIAATVKGGVMLWKSLMYKKVVSQEEADRRAAICVACPHNVFPDRGAFVRWADQLAEASVGKKRSVHHDLLGNCDICSCPLRAKVFFAGDPGLSEDDVSRMRAVGCWQPSMQETQPVSTEQVR